VRLLLPGDVILSQLTDLICYRLLKDSRLPFPFPRVLSKPDELVVCINTGFHKPIDAIAPLRPKRPKSRHHSFLLSQRHAKLPRRKPKIE